MPLFPAFLKIAGRRCLVVGAGRIAEDKIESLLKADAKVDVVAPDASAKITAWAQAGRIRWRKGVFRSSDLNGAFLVIAATSSLKLHAAIYNEARRRGILCNVVDDPKHCDFYYGSVVRRGSLQIAISTEGHSPALAQRLRKELEKEFDSEYEQWLEEIGAVRKRLFSKLLSPERRKELLHRLASEFSFNEFVRRAKRKKK
jgi:precorrin-2 dehydrogenase / sirohydrochlorin ferrochelatase